MDAGKYLQKKRDLVALCQAQGEELKKCREERDEALKALEQKTDRVAEVIAQREEAYGVVAELDAQMRRVRRGG